MMATNSATAPYNFEKIDEIAVKHLPNNAKILLQRQTGGKISDDAIQFYLGTSYVNADNNQTVWGKGASIQLEQLPEFIEKLGNLYKKYSGKEAISDVSKKQQHTNTFADLLEEE